MSKRGRPHLNESEWAINVRLPGDLIRRVDDFAQTEFATRREAVEKLLERGLATESEP